VGLTVEQIKGRLKHLAKTNDADARLLIRIYMMERFLERLTVSRFAENFVIKGGILVTSLVGVAMRSTMDIDASIRNANLSEDDISLIVKEVSEIELDDDITFKIKDVSSIMDEMEYPGVRVAISAYLGKIDVPMKLDISTGDIITPSAISYDYKLMLEDRSISLWTYNLETLLAEKLQTVLVRGVLNTRMRDLYDIKVLFAAYSDKINKDIFANAFKATCKKRNSEALLDTDGNILEIIQQDANMEKLWEAYKRKYRYASGIAYHDVMTAVNELWSMANKKL